MNVKVIHLICVQLPLRVAECFRVTADRNQFFLQPSGNVAFEIKQRNKSEMQNSDTRAITSQRLCEALQV